MMSEDNIKRMSIGEFQELGYLQEVNRRFFHPLGIALEVVQLNDGTKHLGGIWDYRSDSSGIVFEIKSSDEERKASFRKKKDFIDNEIEKRSIVRKALLGDVIEPLD